MRKLVFCGLTALLLGSAALVPQAEARCWWSGHGWHCWYPHAYRWHPHYYHPYAYWHHPYYHYAGHY
jgi:hypothetical protein